MYKEIYTTNASAESPERRAFLVQTEKLLEKGEFQAALASAQERLASFPGDVDAEIVMGKALLGMGMTSEGYAILEEIEKDILRWTSMLKNISNGPGAGLNKIAGIASAWSGIPVEESLSEEMPPIHAGSREGSEMKSPQDPAVLKEFNTVTMAELFIKQGHLEMAKEVLQDILRKDPADAGALAKLRNLELMQNARHALSDERRTAVLNELERWLKRTRTI